MGEATISSSGGQGLYTVDLDYGSAIRTQRLATLNARKTQLEGQITTAETAVTNANFELTSSLLKLNQAIVAYNLSTKDDDAKSALNEKVEDVAVKRDAVNQADSALSILRVNLANVKAEIKYLTGLTLTEQRDVWCADYTENATGTVATIEVNGEQPTIVLAPGGIAPTPAYGNFQDRGVMSPEQVYWNACVLPGWQKFLPTYRSGVIDTINRANDTCALTLDTAKSSAQELDINQDTTLSNIPIDYMTCNSGAFVVGDHVIIQFIDQDWDDPKVIGFVDNPKICGPYQLFFLIENHDRYALDSLGADAGYRGEQTVDTISTPEYGYNIYTDTFSSSKAFDGHTTSTDEFNWPLTLGITHDDIRMRFDVAWVSASDGDIFLDQNDSNFTVGTVDVDAQTDLENLTLVNKLLDSQASQWDSFQIITYSPNYPLQKSSGDLWKFFYPSLGAPKEWTNTGSDPNIIGYTQVAEVRQWRELLESEQGLIDKESLSTFFEQVWEPPDEISVMIDGALVDYVFVRIGTPPEIENDADNPRTVPVATPPTGTGLLATQTTPYDIEWPSIPGVLYQRKA